MKQLHYQWARYGVPGLLGALLILFSIIPIRLTIAAHQAPQPQAILTLGGGNGREEAAAQIARYYPAMEVWVSTGKMPEQAKDIFAAAGVSPNRLHLDYRATDTVTNFTTLVADFKQHDIQHLYLITSDFHMPRAKAIATLVLGSQGIAFTPIAVPSSKPEESVFRIARDCVRSLLWIITRQSGENFRDFLEIELVVNLAKNKHH